jgi:predicted  nucleic acid-binding Zn-ribbon protein
MTTTRSAHRMAKPPSKKSGKGSKAARKSGEFNATSKASSGGDDLGPKDDSGPIVREDVEPSLALSMSDAADKVGVAARTLQRRAAEGRLPVVIEQRGQRSIWRVLPADLAAAFPDQAAEILAAPSGRETDGRGRNTGESVSSRTEEGTMPGGSNRAQATSAARMQPSATGAPGQPPAAEPPSSPSQAGASEPATPQPSRPPVNAGGPESNAARSDAAHPNPAEGADPSKSHLGELPDWVGSLAEARERLQADLDRHKEERHDLERELAVSQTRLESARAQVARLESQVQGLEQSHRSEISSQDERHRQAILALREALEVAREELHAAKATPLSIEAPDSEELQRRSRRQIAGAVAAVAFGLGGPLLWAALELDTVRAEQRELKTERDGLVSQAQRNQGELAARRAELDQLRNNLTRESELKDRHLSDLAATREQAAHLGELLATAQETGELLATERDAAERSARQAELERLQARADAAAKAERLADLEGDLTQLGERLASSEQRRGDLELQAQLESERAELRGAEVERLRGELDAWQAERNELIDQLAALRAQLEAESAKGEPASSEASAPASSSPGTAPAPQTPQPSETSAGEGLVEEPSSTGALGTFIWRRVGGYWWPLPDPTV